MIKLLKISSGLLFSTMTAFASAQVITPDASGFGALPAATFGGSGIPNTAVAQTTVGGVTIGLTATQRFAAPTVTNDGAGTFFALAGVSPDAPSPANPYALWNFNYAITGASTAIDDYNYRLYYDFNPAAGATTASSGMGYAELRGSLLNQFVPVIGTPFPSQNSLNLGMDFLASNATIPLGIVSVTGLVAPTGFVFDPTAIGEYSFSLVAYNKTAPFDFGYGTEAFSTSMIVSAVPEPGEWAMMLAGLGVVGAIARRRRNK